MSPQVLSQVVFPLELLVTLGARKWSRTCVGSQMPFQAVGSDEFLPANITSKTGLRLCSHRFPPGSSAAECAGTVGFCDERRLKNIQSLRPTGATPELSQVLNISFTASCISRAATWTSERLPRFSASRCLTGDRLLLEDPLSSSASSPIFETANFRIDRH